jgi:hypothetical protein
MRHGAATMQAWWRRSCLKLGAQREDGVHPAAWPPPTALPSLIVTVAHQAQVHGPAADNATASFDSNPVRRPTPTQPCSGTYKNVTNATVYEARQHHPWLSH